MKLKQVDSIPNFYVNEESGIYYVRKMVNGTTVDRSTGQRHQKSAYRKYLEIMGELNDTKAGWTNKRVPTLAEWWKTYRQAKVKSDSTWAVTEGIMDRDILPDLGRLRLTSISQSDVERWMNQLRKKGWKENTVVSAGGKLKAIFQAAMEDELIPSNPFAKVHFAKATNRTRVMTVEEQDKIFPLLRPYQQRWLILMLGTGLRVAEGESLTVASLDRKANMLHVKGKGFMGKPRYRDVPLLDASLLAIIDLQTAEAVQPTKALWKQSSATWRWVLATACRKANVPLLSPHVLRHTFATRYLQSGGNIYILSKILGHSNVSTTERVYAHLLTADIAKLSAHVQLQLPSATPAEPGKVIAFTR